MTLSYSILISKWRSFRSSDEVKAIHSPAQRGSLLFSLRIDTWEIIISATPLALDYSLPLTKRHSSSKKFSTFGSAIEKERGVIGEGGDQSKPMILLKESQERGACRLMMQLGDNAQLQQCTCFHQFMLIPNLIIVKQGSTIYSLILQHLLEVTKRMPKNNWQKMYF